MGREEEPVDERLVNAIVRKIGGVRLQTPTDLANLAIRGMSASPFEGWIDNELKPRDFNPPNFEKYTGRSDPVAHLMQYRQRITLETANEAIMCKIFITTLAGNALSWFWQQPENSVNSFEDLG